MKRAIPTWLLIQAFVFVAAGCCCWLPVDAFACDAVMAARDCCCENEGSITKEPPSLTATLQVPAPSLQGPGAFASTHLSTQSPDISFPDSPHLSSERPTERSAPPLYLLNASILI
ncbi:MAG: hypothetical protein QGI83_04380 [Candidatus Latescibacteria bacterium]|nr:hypothetical protein [Candidatus Latescibacterota bacterium]